MMKLLILGGIFVLASVGFLAAWEGGLVPAGLAVMAFGLLLSVIGVIKKDQPDK